MAAAVTELSVPELRAEVERARNQKAKNRAYEKAMSMQLVEKGVATVTAVGIGALEQYKPELATMWMGWGVLKPSAVILGGLMFGLTKGMAKEAGSGLLFGGGIPLLHKLGGKAVEWATV